MLGAGFTRDIEEHRSIFKIKNTKEKQTRCHNHNLRLVNFQISKLIATQKRMSSIEREEEEVSPSHSTMN